MASTLKRVPNTSNKAVRVWTSIGLSFGCGITLAAPRPVIRKGEHRKSGNHHGGAVCKLEPRVRRQRLPPVKRPRRVDSTDRDRRQNPLRPLMVAMGRTSIIDEESNHHQRGHGQ